jgi:polar amino acid transport system substrate-binding protein
MIIFFRKLIFLLYLYPILIFANTGMNSDIFIPENGKVILTVAIEEIGYFPYNYEENGEIKGFS